jgi:3-deoxy-D-manno-octulosonic-acid transferase
MDAFINKETDFVFVAGSTWKKDEDLLVEYINNYMVEKQQFIIVPHNINQTDINRLKNRISKKTILFSEIENTLSRNAKVLIIDTVGLLTKIYSYATVAYVGGGFNNGIHNILEPATFGVPIIIGPNYHKFKEAKELIKLKGCYEVNNILELNKNIKSFQVENHLLVTGKITNDYIQKNIGATLCIISYIKKIIPNFTV